MLPSCRLFVNLFQLSIKPSEKLNKVFHNNIRSRRLSGCLADWLGWFRWLGWLARGWWRDELKKREIKCNCHCKLSLNGQSFNQMCYDDKKMYLLDTFLPVSFIRFQSFSLSGIRPSNGPDWKEGNRWKYNFVLLVFIWVSRTVERFLEDFRFRDWILRSSDW